MLPWRVKAFLSRHFPLAYHLVVNAGIKGNSQGYWDRMLEATWDDPKRNWPTKNVLIESLTRPDQSILDIGCGNGSMLRYLKQRGYSNLHGLEISRFACDRLEASGINMHSGRLPSIPLPDATFDVVIASQVLEHVIRRRLFLSEIARVLKREGRTFIFVPNNCMGPIDEPEHVIVYSATSLTLFLGRFFKELTVTEIHDANHEAPFLFANGARPK